LEQKEMEQKEIWEQLDEDIFRVKIPLPFPLRYVNSYLIRGADGFALIDPGIRTGQAEAAWSQAFGELGIGRRDIKTIVLTHHHPDHLGLAGLFQQRTGAPVYLSAAGREQADYFWGNAREAAAEFQESYIKHGADKAMVERLGEHLQGFIALVSPLPETTPIEDGQRLVLGGRTFNAIHTPGHALGHHMLLHEESGDLFCGDHVLQKITPNINWLPRFDENPLRSFLRSLSQSAKLPVRRAFPGHRETIADFAGRCGEIIEHHRRRLDAIKELLAEPKTAFDLSLELFGSHLSVHQIHFAFVETMAHLVYLQEAGEVESQISSGGTVKFRSCAV